ncbi:MAG: enoyl-CoA hydratase/isomerase family protein [Acidobacteriota bacterium]
MSDQELVRYETQKGVARITLNDPPTNAYTPAMMRQLDDAILEARSDAAVHVLLLCGAGQKMFCAGANIDELRRMEPGAKDDFCLHANETLCRLEQTPKLVIAALNGHTVGGGLEVALAADLRVAAASGGKIGLPEVKLGVLPGTGGTQRLARLLGRSRAIEMMVQGQLLDFPQALQAGLINRIMAPGDFLQQAMEYAMGFTPPAAASLAVGAIKRAVSEGLEMTLAGGLALERELQARLFRTGDAREGLAASREKRRPEFHGR